jgi:hypothetical protein
MVLIMARQGGWTVWLVANTLNIKLISSFMQLKDLLKWADWQPKRTTQLIFFSWDVEEGEMLQMKMMRWEPQHPQTRVAASEDWRTFHLNLVYTYSHIWPPKLLPQSGGVRSCSHLITPICAGGRGQEVHSYCRNSDPQPDLLTR